MKCLAQLVGDIMAFYAFDVEAFRPCLQYTLVNILLSGGIGESEAERDDGVFFRLNFPLRHKVFHGIGQEAP